MRANVLVILDVAATTSLAGSSNRASRVEEAARSLMEPHREDPDGMRGHWDNWFVTGEENIDYALIMTDSRIPYAVVFGTHWHCRELWNPVTDEWQPTVSDWPGHVRDVLSANMGGIAVWVEIRN